MDCLGVNIRIEAQELRVGALDDPSYGGADCEDLIRIEARVKQLVLLNVSLAIAPSQEVPLAHPLGSELLSRHLEISWWLIGEWGTCTMPDHFIEEC